VYVLFSFVDWLSGLAGPSSCGCGVLSSLGVLVFCWLVFFALVVSFASQDSETPKGPSSFPCLNKVSPFLNCFGGSWNEIQTAQLRFGGEVAGGGRIKHLELEVVLIVSPGPNSVWGFCF
jgi:hypothetical protein